MKRLIRLAVCLYPPGWRRRYAREFNALLDDVRPGPRAFFDVLKGALAMNLRIVGVVPVVCVLVGAALGALGVGMSPPTFTSSGLLLFSGLEATSPDAFLQILSAQIPPDVGRLEEVRASTQILMPHVPYPQLRAVPIRVSYRNRDSANAQRTAARLVDALTSIGNARWDVVVIDMPQVPKRRDNPKYFTGIAIGALLGLVSGGILAMVSRFRRGPADAQSLQR